jgi:hypothetical protein
MLLATTAAWFALIFALPRSFTAGEAWLVATGALQGCQCRTSLSMSSAITPTRAAALVLQFECFPNFSFPYRIPLSFFSPQGLVPTVIAVQDLLHAHFCAAPPFGWPAKSWLSSATGHTTWDTTTRLVAVRLTTAWP